MNNKDNNERIERYLREQMTPEENESFLNDLRNDKELREEAQMIALLIKEMKEEQSKQDEAIIQAVLSTKKRATTINIIRWTLSIAAMFILIFGVTTLWKRQSDTDALFNQYYTSYDTSLSRGDDNEAVTIELADLYNKVGTEKDMTLIITRLQTIYDNIQDNSEDGIDYYFYENDIAWYLALAYVKDSQVDKAKSILEKTIQDNPDTPLCHKAGELIMKLSGL